MMETPRFGTNIFPNQEAETEEQLKKLKDAGELYESRMAARRGTLMKRKSDQQNNKGGRGNQARGGKRRSYGHRGGGGGGGNQGYGGQGYGYGHNQGYGQGQWQHNQSAQPINPAQPGPSGYQPRGQQGNRGGQKGRRPFYRH